MSLSRQFKEHMLVIASHNEGKVQEIAKLLRDYVPDCASAKRLHVTEPEETEDSFIGNAELKALHVSRACGFPALADDSGLVINALDGQPGIYSGRWATGGGGFTSAIRRIQTEMGDTHDRTAAFVCALSIAWPDGHVETVQGQVEGTIATECRGSYGFGYDSIFIPNGHYLTFAEMYPLLKHSISHRADAFRKLIDRCFVS